MELARTLLKLWRLRALILVGVVLAAAAGVGSISLLHSRAYSSASTQMIVDASRSALGDPQEDITPFTSRAVVFARLMTTPQVLKYIGNAAGIPGNLIAASGPEELAAPQAMHVPTVAAGNQLLTTAARYKLNFLQNPELPTVDIYSEAPTTKQAIALANGAVSGFAAYMQNLDAQSNVPAAQRVTIRQAGAATGGVVDPTEPASLAAIISACVLLLWCGLLLFVGNLSEQLRVVRAELPAVAAGDYTALARLPEPLPRKPLLSTGDAAAHGEDDLGEASFASNGSSNAAGGSGEVVRRAWLRKSS